MEVINSRENLGHYRRKLKNDRRSVGFIPTMGALHDGHLSLVEKARNDNDTIIVSIFVNPTQFNNISDLEKYPRTLDKDIELLKNVLRSNDIIFLPSEKEMYPDVEYCDYDFGSSDKVMEGKYRPGHFTGVAQIVEKLLKLTEPDKAYFGLKDYQQFVIINELVRQRNFPVQIIGCPTIREADGLAMSSRNRLLSPDQRNSAAKISQALFMMREKAEYISLQEMKKWVVGTINSDKNMEVEYFEIVDSTDLSPLNEWNDSLNRRGCIAVWVGTTRLIDNISIEGVKYNN